MKVFLSWSGDRSKYIAETFRDWLPMVIQALDPWISVDIAKGQKWNEELTKALKVSKVCILFLTSDNVMSPYMHYEAGAIDSNENSKNCTFLFDVKEQTVKYPLSAFQNTKYEKRDVFRLMTSINEALAESNGSGVSEVILKKTFDLHWPSLEENLNATPNNIGHVPERSNDDLLSEILTTVRRLESQSASSPTTWFDPALLEPLQDNKSFARRFNEIKHRPSVSRNAGDVAKALTALQYDLKEVYSNEEFSNLLDTVHIMYGNFLTINELHDALGYLRNIKGSTT